VSSKHLALRRVLLLSLFLISQLVLIPGLSAQGPIVPKIAPTVRP